MVAAIDDDDIDVRPLNGKRKGKILTLPAVPHLATHYDPYLSYIGPGPGVRKQTNVGFNEIRRMFHQCGLLGAIRNTQLNQMVAHAEPNHEGEEQRPGWKIGLRKQETKRGAGKDPKKTEVSAADQKRIDEVTVFLENLWSADHEDVRKRVRKGRDYPETGLTGFFREILTDSIEIDALCFEKVRTNDGRLFTCWPVDGATINRFFPAGPKENDDPRSPPSAARAMQIIGDSMRWLESRDDGAGDRDAEYVQVIDGRPYAYFTRDEMCYWYRNGRPDVRHKGFGYPEAEQMITTVTGLLNAEGFNRNNFTNGQIPEGILALSGIFDSGDLEGLKRSFQADGVGVGNAGRLPIITAAEGDVAKWISMRMGNREMEYGGWLDWLARLACAIFCIAPEEVNFQGYTKQPALQEAGPEAELDHSKEKWLIPRMHAFGRLLTEEIVWEFYDDLELRFTGIDAEDEAEQEDRALKRIQTGLTLVNEERKKRGDDPIDEDWADAPANGILMQVYTASKQEQQQKDMAGQPPAEGEERKNYFRAPQQGGDQPEGEEPGGEQPMPPGAEDQEQQIRKAQGEFARAFALSGWRPEEE